MQHDDRVFQRDQSDDPAGFREGWFLHIRSGHVGMPVRVWFGPPVDPVSGDELDRSWRWQVELAGVVITPDDRVDPRSRIAQLDWVWPKALSEPIAPPENDYRRARIDYARRHDPRDPFGHRTGQVDWLDSTTPF